MSELTPTQRRIRGRVESLISAASPLLDLVLGVGDRISRVVEPEDHEYYPVRSGADAPSLEPAELAHRSAAQRSTED
jgi:hypothetical protein